MRVFTEKNCLFIQFRYKLITSTIFDVAVIVGIAYYIAVVASDAVVAAVAETALVAVDSLLLRQL